MIKKITASDCIIYSRQPLFHLLLNGVYVGIDNSNGHAEEFFNLRQCRRWLLNSSAPAPSLEMTKFGGNDADRKHEPGICPNCGSDDLDYDGFTVEDGSCLYRWRCDGCGTSDKERYALTFSEHITD
jgi:hypothetical protein